MSVNVYVIHIQCLGKGVWWNGSIQRGFARAPLRMSLLDPSSVSLNPETLNPNPKP